MRILLMGLVMGNHLVSAIFAVVEMMQSVDGLCHLVGNHCQEQQACYYQKCNHINIRIGFLVQNYALLIAVFTPYYDFI